MPFSHHSHSGEFCKHAAGTLEDVVKEAVRQKFVLFGLTEHVPRYRTEDLYPEEADLEVIQLERQFQAFLVEAERLKAAYAGTIDLLVGLETEYISALDLQRLQEILAQGKVEYVVGSIHHVGGKPIDFDLATFEQALSDCGGEDPWNEYLCRYFDAQYDLIRSVKPEVIGHLDLCRLYKPSISFSSYPAVITKIERNIEEAVRYGALFEVNAAALRKKWATAYPGEDALKLILKHGGRLTLSDDSHGPHMVGLNYGPTAEYLRRMNVTELWYLERTSVANEGGRWVRPAQVKGDWWEHPFWEERHPST
ncbi:histidinol phosphate phosphatase H [Cylindrobasidium torrendii FP15055 ss-10]|uniref:Histidinol-phosphatase n=1 Tax=Cylindrobasidium torrendii FP15055 ss-10 TaxID=1314674 RepID=A0A0D7BH88_9AGAR|nr:histidinol phosphate phosphatase H [Cylindrobasidium torrendii FP15055 ss-10]